VPRRVEDATLERADAEGLPVCRPVIDDGRDHGLEPEHLRLSRERLEPAFVARVQRQGGAGLLLGLRGARDVIDVTVGADDPRHPRLGRDESEDARDLAAGVDQHRLARAVARDDVGVRREGSDDGVPDYEHGWDSRFRSCRPFDRLRGSTSIGCTSRAQQGPEKSWLPRPTGSKQGPPLAGARGACVRPRTTTRSRRWCARSG
jgi:hypothetical protein